MSHVLEVTECYRVYVLNDDDDRQELLARIAEFSRDMIGATIETYSFDGSHPSHLWQPSAISKAIITQIAHFPKPREDDARVELYLNSERYPSIKFFADLLYGSATIPAQSGEIVRIELHVKDGRTS